jgi:hypothetical protein
MDWVGFEHTIPASGRAKTVHALDREATVTTLYLGYTQKISTVKSLKPVPVAERSKAWSVFGRLVAGIVGFNPTQDMDVWYVYVFILCLCCPVFR